MQLRSPGIIIAKLPIVNCFGERPGDWKEYNEGIKTKDLSFRQCNGVAVGRNNNETLWS